ncbi:MAG TPA: methyl-accepting chemotaxis protein [Rhizobiales bacterium]|nr:methyl-accepting chemotaxis protein [Hyphomicrobiales bacterium]
MVGETASTLLRVSLARTGKWAGGIGLVGGFVADVLNPLAPFAAYIALTGAVAALLIGIAIVFRLVVADRGVPAMIFAATTAAIAGGVYTLQQQADANDGVVAKLVPAVAELQRTVGLVAADVDEIRKTVTETQKTVTETQQTVTRTQQAVAETQKTVTETQATVTRTEEAVAETQKAVGETQQAVAEARDATTRIEEQTRVVAENQAVQQKQAEALQETAERIAVSIEAIADGFARLASQGGVIAEPKRPDEFYHNARLQELGGDMVNARRSYLAFADFDVDAVDPYLRFATLLRVQDGRSGAREVLGTLAEKSKSPAIRLVHALQFDDAQRAAKLDAFLADNAAYGPAFFLKAEEFSEDRLGVQTLADKKAEAEWLSRFVAAEKDGTLVRHFIDHALLGEWLERANRRLATLGDLSDPSRFMPRIVPQRSNADWMITVSLPEPATAILWRLGDSGDFTSTGQLAMMDQSTGKPMPNPTFVLPATTSAASIWIKYLDMRGRETGPFAVRFDPDSMLQEANKQILEQFWTSWIAFDASGNRGLVYFTHMLSYRCAIKAVHYGFNGGPLAKSLDMPACNPADPYALPDGYLPYFRVGDDVASMSVQVTYADGTQSPVREFRR